MEKTTTEERELLEIIDQVQHEIFEVIKNDELNKRMKEIEKRMADLEKMVQDTFIDLTLAIKNIERRLNE